MEQDDDIRPVYKVRILPNDPTQVTDQFTDALYSSSFSNTNESADAPILKPQIQPTSDEPTKRDGVSTGTFGNLVRKVNQGATLEERAANARHRIRFNLKKVGPRPKTTDECEAWRKYLF